MIVRGCLNIGRSEGCVNNHTTGPGQPPETETNEGFPIRRGKVK
jgi:hypothetical protein